MNDDQKLEFIADAILIALTEVTKRHRVSTGVVMDALLAVFVETAKGSPAYKPDELVKQVTEYMKEAVK